MPHHERRAAHLRYPSDRLKCSPKTARSPAKRLRLPTQRGDDGKLLVSVDLANLSFASPRSRQWTMKLVRGWRDVTVATPKTGRALD